LDDEDPALVVIGDSEQPEQTSRDYVDYCVEGDLLHWRQQSDSVELVLRRSAGPFPETADVPDIH
jgi:hypothetical protein